MSPYLLNLWLIMKLSPRATVVCEDISGLLLMPLTSTQKISKLLSRSLDVINGVMSVIAKCFTFKTFAKNVTQNSEFVAVSATVVSLTISRTRCTTPCGLNPLILYPGLVCTGNTFPVIEAQVIFNYITV